MKISKREPKNQISKHQCLKYVDFQKTRAFFEITVIVYTILLIVVNVREILIHNIHVYLKFFYANPTKIFLLVSLILNLIIIPLRLACNSYGEDILTSMVIIFLGLHSLYYGRGARFTCVFVHNIHTIFKDNFLRFVIVCVIFLMGFSQSIKQKVLIEIKKNLLVKRDFWPFEVFLLVFQFLGKYTRTNHVFTNFFQAMIDTVGMTYAEVAAEFEAIEFVSSYRLIGELYTVVYLFFGPALLVNILIAMMDHTQEIALATPNEWIRQVKFNQFLIKITFFMKISFYLGQSGASKCCPWSSS